MEHSPHRRAAAATRTASSNNRQEVAAAPAGLPTTGDDNDDLPHATVPVTPQSTVSASRRNKREAILKRRFKRKEEDEKPLIAEEPKIRNEESDRSLLQDEAATADIGGDVDEAKEEHRPTPSRKVSPLRGKKLSVARLKKMNTRSQEETEEGCGGPTTPLLSSVSALEPTPPARSRTPSDPRPRQPESASSVASLMVKSSNSSSSGTPGRGTRRRELVMQRLSSRKDADGGPATRSCSPMTRQVVTVTRKPSISRSSSLGCSVGAGSTNEPPQKDDDGASESRQQLLLRGVAKSGAGTPTLTDRQSPLPRATPPRMYRRSISSPSPAGNGSSMNKPSSVDSDSEDESRAPDFRPVNVAPAATTESDSGSSSLMRSARERTQFHRSIRSRVRSSSMDASRPDASAATGSSTDTTDTPGSGDADATQGGRSAAFEEPSRSNLLHSQSSSSDDKAGEHGEEIDFISGAPSNGARSVQGVAGKQRSASAVTSDACQEDNRPPIPEPIVTVNMQHRVPSPRTRVESPSDIRSASSAESMRSDSKVPDARGETYAAGSLPSPSEAQPVDSSWDSNHVYFGRFSEEMKKVQGTGGFNMFDTDSWVRTEVSFQSATLAVPNVVDTRATGTQKTTSEEKKENDPDGSSVQRETASEGVESAVDRACVIRGLDNAPLHLYTTAFSNADEVKSEISRSEAGLTDILGDYDVSVVSRSSKLVSMITLDPDCATNDAEHLVVETLPHDSEPRITEVDEELSSSGNWILGSPPPPPPPGTPSKRKSRRTPQTLENPSPGPRTSTTPAATPRASGSKKTRFFGDDFVPPSRNQLVGVVPCPDTTTDAATESDSKPEPSARSTGAKLNRNFSPVSSAVVMHDSKLAEKVDFAISVAASKFEEQVEKAASAESIHVVAHEDVSGGAFTTWSVLSGPASAEQDGERDPPQLSNQDPNDVDNSITSINSGASGTFAPKSVETGALNDPGKRGVCPLEHPSPFEDALDRAPQILSTILSFLGDPVAVCRVKMTSRACLQYVDENEHRLMRDAVRLGGMSMNVRPSFWLWVTLQKSSHLSTGYVANAPRAAFDSIEGLEELVREGRTGKWHHVIDRDVERAFGNLPPHKTGARFRTDSIVRALVTWGKNRIIKRGLKGSGPPPIPSAGNSIDSDDVSLAPTDTVSDWGGVTPAGSFTSSMSDAEARNDKAASRDRHSRRNKRTYQGDLALSGNALTEDMKASLQYKLSFILHALASAHPDVGYCQGMDYVVAHLLRILQDTVRWSAATGKLPSVMLSAPATRYRSDMSPQQRLDVYNDIDRSVVVEEACFRVMDSFLSVYNLRHFYWPELRCLKTCCLVFERLIKIKLPVLADHFEHHELNVGLFALGWFQTLFLYLPSMPSATVCHMWDIWLVERSFKIFFRVGTAILFLSQPILLNHELEGMMRYLNELSDATLLSPDILIACALQIKVTNRLLMELEREVTASTTAQVQ